MPVTGRWLAIVNPVAGSGVGGPLARSLAARFAREGITLDVARTPGPGEGARLASAAVEDGYTVIMAVGGDGTANEIVNGILGTPARLALYPIGTGNDAARNLGYPRDRRRIPRFLAGASEREIDVGIANDRAFLNGVSVGVGGSVAARAHAYRRRVGAAAAYAVASLAAIVSSRPVAMRLTVDGEAREGRYLAVAAANGVHVGGGMRPAPAASLDDGMLDLVLAGDLGRRAALAALVRLYRGRHVDGRTIEAARARSLQVELDRPIGFELDGEVGRAARVDIGVRAGALRVLA